MRPLTLKVKGFTAFRDEVEVDFGPLEVFAIAGQTGSGKSSLLDALTYALYGRVERVGDRVSQLISQGQARMAVTLVFEVGRDRYRVTRSTPAKGATKIMLERFAGDGSWKQAGDGADRVKDVERMLTRAIGLTYDGFTRSVLLPQGKFAEFLVGDAKKRRDILTELLGLSLFRRMAERAGTIAKESGLRAQERSLSLEREYADVTPEALKEAKSAAKDAARREKQLARLAEEIVEILERWREATFSVEELRGRAREVAGMAESTGQAVVELASLAEQIDAAEAEALARKESAESAESALAEAQAALAAARTSFGLVQDLNRTHARALARAEAVRGRGARCDQLAAGERSGAELAERVQRTEAAWMLAGERLAVAEAEAAAAEAALEESRHANLVAAVSAGLRVGDPCPVCGNPLEKAPTRSAAGALDRATQALARARAQVEAGRKGAVDAEHLHRTAQRDLETNVRDRERIAAEVADLDARIAAEEARLAESLGTPLPTDPVAATEERLEELQRLDLAEREAAGRFQEAATTLAGAEQERARTANRLELLRDRLITDHAPLFDRAARAIGTTGSPIAPPVPPKDPDVAALQSHAGALGQALEVLTAALVAEMQQRSSIEGRLLEEANGMAAGLVESSDTLEGLAQAVNEGCRTATAAVATTAQRVADLAERLARKKLLAEEVRALEERNRLFKVLALELRADRLVAFLQAEALQVLAVAGSERLAGLSEGRYRVVCRDDEFFVLDTWNGDEERSVRTLSGGETFLASLALALALADQVRSLSVTDRARLDSLFLDEGFGTLDQESLKVVVDAIERLAGDGRLVGVITHVRDLAEQFPRIEVEKSHRGSTLKVVA
jgi:exonuclease SbcC